MTMLQRHEALWRDYRAQLVRFVARRVEDVDTAEDIVHDVLVRAYRKRHTLRDGGNFQRWLFQITRNAVIDHYRARRPVEPLPADLAAPDEPDSRAARRELAACLRPLVDALPERYREAIRLSELQGLTQKEAAQLLGLSLSGAKSRVQRGRRLLEAKLLECCAIEFDHRGVAVDCEPHDDGRHGGRSGERACGSC